jgi:hypothetical protein
MIFAEANIYKVFVLQEKAMETTNHKGNSRKEEKPHAYKD